MQLIDEDFCPLILSMDDKSKVKIGVPAVSRYVHSKHYFLKGKESHLPDHDFSIGKKYLISVSGKS